jgi:DNA-binding NarL/FixJ family response regulator
MKNLLEPKIEVAAMTDNLLSLIDSIQSLDPSVAIVHVANLHQPHSNIIKHLGQRFPDLRIILVGDVDDPAMIQDLLTQNVKAYVHIQNADTQLIRAVDEVLHGDTFLPAPEDSGENEQVSPHES